ncbi:hypothetical protein DNK63_22195 [Providencia rettgeri]|nr:hypothetical protein DNK63_22195 [Providencia rettgeri]
MDVRIIATVRNEFHSLSDRFTERCTKPTVFVHHLKTAMIVRCVLEADFLKLWHAKQLGAGQENK